VHYRESVTSVLR